MLLDLPSSDGEAAARAIGPTARFAPADVASTDDAAAAVELAANLGDLRIVVNCAGVVSRDKIFGKTGALPWADFERMVRINLVGTFNVIRLAVEKIAATDPINGERGVIIDTASVAAFEGQIGHVAYAASKGGVAAMTLALARELGHHLIRVVTIAPGIFETPMVAGLPEEVQRSAGRQAPHPAPLGKPSEFAALATHIVENAMLNGETIRLDGAIRMGAQ